MAKSTLFICFANVGRSQMAEGYYNFLTKGNYAISAGVKGDTYRDTYKDHPAEEIIALMQEENIDISHQRIDQLNSKLVGSVERVVVLCDKKEVPSQVLENAKEVIFMHVTDPYGHSFGRMREIRDEIKKLVIKLAEN